MATKDRPLRHLAVLLDGHRRWARQHGLPVREAYVLGAAKVPEFLAWCAEAGIEVLTVMATSVDNVAGRDRAELDDLATVIVSTLREIAGGGQWQIRPVGALHRLGWEVEAALAEIRAHTVSVTARTLNVAIAYNGREEIVDAVRGLLVERRGRGTLDTLPETITVEDIGGRLYTGGQPDIDLVIRTSGEQRLSTFMPWQTTYAELHFPSVAWPDFTRADFEEAVALYRRRHRRFGV